MLSRLQRALGPPLQRLADMELPASARGRVPRRVTARMPRAVRKRLDRPAQPSGPGRLPSLGHDVDAGHRSYVQSLDAAGVRWLNTKPFSAPPNHELARCLHSFAHIVEGLALPEGAEVLDLGCGPGWISEWLARLGYRVTGVDVSEDMVAIARERLARVPRVDDAEPAPQADFAAMASDELPYEDRFDAAVLYDAMHHFTDERATLAAVHRALIPGGRIYLHEGVRPPEGSEGERELIEEMERYGTLESPFEPAYLVRVIEEAGFVDVARYVEADRLMDLGAVRREMADLRRRARYPETNTIIARKPAGDGGAAGGLAAEIAVRGVRREGGAAIVDVAVANSGAAPWAAATRYPFPTGTVTVAPYVPLAGGGRRELDRVALPRSVRPGESVEVEIRLRAGEPGGGRLIEVDLVAEGVCWFGDRGSSPARAELPIR